MDGRLVHVVNSNIQVGGGSMVWWWRLLPCAALFLRSTLASQLFSSLHFKVAIFPFSYLPEHLQLWASPLPLAPWGCGEAAILREVCAPLCNSWTELTVDLSSGGPMCQAFCFAVAWFTLEDVPPFREVTPRDSCEPCTFVIEKTIHWSGNRRHWLNDAFLYNIYLVLLLTICCLLKSAGLLVLGNLFGLSRKKFLIF